MRFGFSAGTCRALPTFANGNRTLNHGIGFDYGAVYAFECAPGLRREGPAALVCRASGKWSAPEQPFCKSTI